MLARPKIDDRLNQLWIRPKPFMKKQGCGEKRTNTGACTVAPLIKTGVLVGFVQTQRHLLNSLASMAWHCGRFNRSSIQLGGIVERRFLADHHAAAYEALRKRAVFQVFEQMRLAGSEISAHQQSAHLLIGCEVVGNLAQLVDKE